MRVCGQMMMAGERAMVAERVIVDERVMGVDQTIGDLSVVNAKTTVHDCSNQVDWHRRRFDLLYLSRQRIGSDLLY